jgi:predicted DCC family thiol-disulfide oxidoreductase YuxK
MNTPATTLIYDGDCAFCSRCVDWGLRSLSAFPNLRAFQNIQPEDFGLSQADVRKAVWLISENTKLSGARAVAWILKQQSKLLWRIIGHLIDWYPVRPIAALGYRLVANNRHRLPGATSSCKMVTLD